MTTQEDASKEATILQLFSEIDRSTNQGEYNKALKSIDKILKLNAKDFDAIHCKAISLIRLEKYQNALEFLTKNVPEDKLVAVKAYCLYRLNQWGEVLNLCRKYKGAENEEMGLWHLEAQAAYRMEEFSDSLEIYYNILQKKDKKDDSYSDILTNFIAAKSALLFSGGQPNEKYTLADNVSSSNTFELAYNTACSMIAQGRLKQAENLLKTAKIVCRKSLSQEDYSEKEIERELATIIVQLAYVHQLQGRINEATDLCQSVIKSKAADMTALAIASNNLVVARKENDVFDSARKLRAASAKNLETKLFKVQRQAIAINEALLSLYMHKYSVCQDTARKLLQIYPENDYLYVLLSSISYRQKKTTKAIQELQEYAQTKSTSLPINFALIQLQLLQSNIQGSIATLEKYLESLEDEGARYQPALVGLLVWLYEKSGQSDKSVHVLEKAGSFSKSDAASVQSSSILKQTAAFKLKTRRFSEAAQDYEQLVKANPEDSQALAGLIVAYSQCDVSLAEKYESSLATIKHSKDIDVDSLEKNIPGVKKSYKKLDAKSDNVGKSSVKKKRKRKPLLPKNFDPNVPPDPERWLPKRERSTYKVKGKRKQQLMKGPQGVAVAGGGIGGTGSANIAGKSPNTGTPEQNVVNQSNQQEPPNIPSVTEIPLIYTACGAHESQFFEIHEFDKAVMGLRCNLERAPSILHLCLKATLFYNNMPKIEKHSWDIDFPVYCAGFSPAGELLIGGGGGASKTGVLYSLQVTNWKLDKLSEIELATDEDAPSSMAFHPEDNVIACAINSNEEKIKAGENQNCRIFRYSNEKIQSVNRIQTLTSKNPNDYQKVTAFSKDGRYLATGGSDSRLMVLKYPSLDVAFPPVNYDQKEIYDVDFDTTGKQLCAYGLLKTENASRPLIVLFLKKLRNVYSGHAEASESFLYTVINSTSRNKAFIVKWDQQTWDKVAERIVSKKPIVAFTISDNGKLLAYASSDMSIGVVSSDNLRVLLKVPNVHQQPAVALSFNHDTSLLVSGSFDNTVHIIKIPEKFGIAVPLALIVIVLFSLLAVLVALIITMQSLVLVKDHPRSLVLCQHFRTPQPILLFENNGNSPKPECNVLFLKSSNFSLIGYRQLNSRRYVYGILGLIQLEKAVVTECKPVGQIRTGESVNRILDVEFYSLTNNAWDSGIGMYEEEDTLDQSRPYHPCSHLRKLLSNKHFYFSSDFDLTRTLQVRNLASASDKYSFDDRFLWNKYMINGLLRFRAKLNREEQAHLDQSGALTETILDANKLCFSYTQIRGSVPVFWEQQGIQVIGHKVQISRGADATQPAVERHFTDLANRYGELHIINLLGPKEGEALLAKEYHNQIDILKSNGTQVLITDFDFNTICKNANYENVKLLLVNIEEELKAFELFVLDTESNVPIVKQKGIFRTNCVDCLDRTNVVQTTISRTILESYLPQLKFTSRQLDTIFYSHSHLWAENGDSLSKIYAGTGALKSEFTRSGKITLAGVIGDASKSVNRFYINNFQDKSKQEVIDLLLGKQLNQSVITIHDPVHDLVLEALNKRIEEYSTKSTISVFVGTYNLNGKLPSGRESIDQWLFAFHQNSSKQPDLVVIGFQEIVELKPQQIVSADPDKLRTWEKEITNLLNNRRQWSIKYVSLRSRQLVGTALLIYAKSSNVSNIRNVECVTKKTGLGGMAGNKGAVAIRMDYHDTSICFVTAHFAAGLSNYDERNRDYHTINDGISFRQGRQINNHDAVIWLGDFNYRISETSEAVRNFASLGNLHALIKSDQLIKQHKSGAVFRGYTEGTLTFLPTYKYDTFSDKYDTSEKSRIPAWTDRILYRGMNITQSEYSRAELKVSDHRPVMALFNIEYDEVAKEKIQQELYNNIQASLSVGTPTNVLIDVEDTNIVLNIVVPQPSSEFYQWWNDDTVSSSRDANEYATTNHRLRNGSTNPFDVFISSPNRSNPSPVNSENPFDVLEEDQDLRTNTDTLVDVSIPPISQPATTTNSIHNNWVPLTPIKVNEAASTSAAASQEASTTANNTKAKPRDDPFQL
ncbi:9469_t:CDS:10 [Ambispora gerdemannii]|uniref:phosphoinositide 5-phosphatase n=1 Tax=Ambispora gerdemannii TaxID=144530 RepID=A0A9N9F3W8_9GLOM|nr:9469_t:CDS:10 [Ambispora gerdemannii]